MPTPHNRPTINPNRISHTRIIVNINTGGEGCLKAMNISPPPSVNELWLALMVGKCISDL